MSEYIRSRIKYEIHTEKELISIHNKIAQLAITYNGRLVSLDHWSILTAESIVLIDNNRPDDP